MFIIASLDRPVSITTILIDLNYLKQYVDRTECGIGFGHHYYTFIYKYIYTLYIIIQLARL